MNWGSIPEWVEAIGTCGTLVAAVWAVLSWRKQHKSTTEDLAAVNTLKAVYRFQGLIEDFLDQGADISWYDEWRKDLRPPQKNYDF